MDGDDGALGALLRTGSLEPLTDHHGRPWWRLNPSGRALVVERLSPNRGHFADRFS